MTAEHNPSRLIENREIEGFRKPRRLVLNQRLQGNQAVLVDSLPESPRPRNEKIGAVGNRFGAVINEKNEGRGENPEAEKAKNEADHRLKTVFLKLRARRTGITLTAAPFNYRIVRPAALIVAAAASLVHRGDQMRARAPLSRLWAFV